MRKEDEMKANARNTKEAANQMHMNSLVMGIRKMITEFSTTDNPETQTLDRKSQPEDVIENFREV